MKNDIHYKNVQDVRIAAALMKQHHAVVVTAVVERYPPRRDWFTHDMVRGGVFAIQFFLADGTNCGYWLPDLEGVLVFAKPRVWTVPKPEVITIH